MPHRVPPVIDMTPDGRFRAVPPRPAGWRGLPLSFRIMAISAAVAAVTIAAIVAVFALWLLLLLIPVAAVAAVVAYASLQWRRWRRRATGGTPIRTQ